MKSALALVTVLLVAGCTTLNQGTVDSLARAAGGAARLAAAYDTQHRGQYALVRDALDVLITREQWDDASLALALKMLPDVSDPKIALYVEGSLLVFDLVKNAFFTVETAAAVKAFAIEIRDGLALGLAAEAGGARGEAAARSAPAPAAFPLIKRPPRPLQKPKVL